MTRTRWTSRLRWDGDRTTHDGRTYELWRHGPTIRGRDHWYLHQVLDNDVVDPGAVTGSLGTRRDRARRMAELELLGWRPATREHGSGRQRLRAPDGVLHALDDVLSGAVPH